MIVRENGVFFTLIRQHDHGLLSGEMASHWGNEDFSTPSHKLVLTASLHDLSWIENDSSPQWNEEENKPYDFTTLPFVKRLPMYRKGLNRLEQIIPYGGLLTSLHYCTFLKKATDKNAEKFLLKEEERQEKWKNEFFEKPIEDDLRQLQLFDNLSLYVCLNEPGTPKEKEHPWYKDGIGAKDKNGNPITIKLRWLNERTITLKPFPFRESWSTILPYSKVRKSLGPKDPDINECYQQHLRFVPDD